MGKSLENSRSIISKITTTLLLVAFLLLFLVGISLPIIKPIYLVTFQSTSGGPVSASTATKLRFGVWGICAYNDSEVGASQIDGAGYCVGPLFRYTVSSDIQAKLGIPDRVANVIEAAIRTVLILHPIAALLALIAAIPFCIPASDNVSIITLYATILASLLATVIFGIELALPILGKRKMANLQDFNFSVKFGNGVWMVLAAVLCLWVAIALVALLQRPRKAKQVEGDTSAEGGVEGQPAAVLPSVT